MAKANALSTHRPRQQVSGAATMAAHAAGFMHYPHNYLLRRPRKAKLTGVVKDCTALSPGEAREKMTPLHSAAE